MAETGIFRACSHQLTWDEINVVSVREKLSPGGKAVTERSVNISECEDTCHSLPPLAMQGSAIAVDSVESIYPSPQRCSGTVLAAAARREWPLPHVPFRLSRIEYSVHRQRQNTHKEILGVSHLRLRRCLRSRLANPTPSAPSEHPLHTVQTAIPILHQGPRTPGEATTNRQMTAVLPIGNRTKL